MSAWVTHGRLWRFPVFAVLLTAATLVPLTRAGAQGSDERPAVSIALLADGLAAPTFLSEPDDGTGRRFVTDQTGELRIITRDGELLDQPFLDLSERLVELDANYDERGLLGLAFHLEFRDNGRFFVYYSAPARDAAPEDWDHTSHLSEFRVSENDDNRADRTRSEL